MPDHLYNYILTYQYDGTKFCQLPILLKKTDHAVALELINSSVSLGLLHFLKMKLIENSVMGQQNHVI